MKNKLFIIFKLLLPYLVIAISVLVYYDVKNNGKQKKTEHPYYIFHLAAQSSVSRSVSWMSAS